MSDICVIGAGPAGSTFAARMAQLGHRVCLIERARFPRPHLGESLSPGVLPLLQSVGVRERIEAAGFPRIRRVRVAWDGPVQLRDDARQQGRLVDRGTFDQLLLEHAAALGVRVLQPAQARASPCAHGGWVIDADSAEGPVRLHADFLARANGRCGRFGADKQRIGARTVALYAYWREHAFPEEPCIEAGRDAWFWGVPLPDGSTNTLAFVDAEYFHSSLEGTLESRFMALLSQSSLAAGCRHARRVGSVRATDATAYLDRACVTPSSITVGDAALALDPISSSGVQKAIQSALAAAIVANTLLRRPEHGAAAQSFYRDNLGEAAERHARWAAIHYGSVAARQGGAFWKHRATSPPPRAAAVTPRPRDAASLAQLRVEVSPELDIVDQPCIDGNFITVRPALRHPNLERPVAYLGGWDLAPLIRQAQPGATAIELARAWSTRIPWSQGLAVATWLINEGLLVESRLHGSGGPIASGGSIA